MQLADYLKELRKVKTLDLEEEQALWAAFKERGDEGARQRLIESYQPLVFKQAAPFAQLDCALDLIQEGTVGLIEAAERYDHTRGVAFSLFAVHRIRGRMMDFLRREGQVDVACMEENLEGGNLKENLQWPLYTTDAADPTLWVDPGDSRTVKKKNETIGQNATTKR